MKRFNQLKIRKKNKNFETSSMRILFFLNQSLVKILDNKKFEQDNYKVVGNQK